VKHFKAFIARNNENCNNGEDSTLRRSMLDALKDFSSRQESADLESPQENDQLWKQIRVFAAPRYGTYINDVCKY
jgi:hypothetical protein